MINNRTMLVCRVLVGRTCRGNRTMTTCPIGYDATTDKSTIYVVYSNRQILPVYVITYNDNFYNYQNEPVPYRKKNSYF